MIPTPDVPATAPLDIDVTVEHGRARVVLTGEIDITNADDLLGRIGRCLDDPRVTRVVADLDAVTFLDSSGLRSLLFSRRHAEAMGKSFVIEHHHGHIATVIDIAGLTDILT